MSDPSIAPPEAATGDETPPADTTPPPVDATPPPVEGAPAEGNKDTTDGGDQPTPESYSDFNLPEGVELDEAVLGKAIPVFKELGLSQEQAQKLIDLQSEMVQEGARKQGETFNQLMNQWQDEVRNDPELGGEKLEENIGIAKLAIDKFGDEELRDLLEDHGVGNHRAMVRFMFKIGKLLKEDVPGGMTGNAPEKKDRVEILYGKQ